MPDRPVLRSLGWGAVSAGIFWGCTLDWSVRVEHSGDGGAGAADGALETSDDGSNSRTDADGTDAATVDADCDALRLDIRAREGDARKCTLGAPAQCAEQEMSVCCKVWVAKRDSSATIALRQAVSAFEQAGCAIDCSSVTCSVTAVSSCVQEPSTATVCSP